jgi:hypothetical protein
MSIGKRDNHPIRRQAQAHQRIRREAWLRLFPIADYRRTSLFEPRNRIAQRRVILRIERCPANLSILKRAHRLKQRSWPRNASNRFCLHAAKYKRSSLHTSST